MISFTVYGKPQPQGSASAHVRNGKAFVTSANAKLKPYRHTVTQVALEAVNAIQPAPMFGKHVPVALRLLFVFRKPPSVNKKRTQQVVKPDCDKLIRATCDALTGAVYHDDAQVVRIEAEKVYGDVEMVQITAEEV